MGASILPLSAYEFQDGADLFNRILKHQFHSACLQIHFSFSPYSSGNILHAISFEPPPPKVAHLCHSRKHVLNYASLLHCLSAEIVSRDNAVQRHISVCFIIFLQPPMQTNFIKEEKIQKIQMCTKFVESMIHTV